VRSVPSGKLDDGNVARIDPATGRQLARIPTGCSGLPACQGIGADVSQLWVCAGENKLVTIDPATDEASRPFRQARLNDQARFRTAAGQMWIVSAEATALLGLNPEDHSVQSTVDLGTFCSDIASDATTVWVVCLSEGKVLAVDPAEALVTDEVTLPGAREASAASSFWGGVRRRCRAAEP
jgi:streptogramin lyase